MFSRRKKEETNHKLAEGNFVVGRRVFDKDLKFHWHTVDFETFEFERPIVLVLGGNLTKTNKDANWNAKIVQSLLGDFSNDVDLLTINYNGGDKTSTQAFENCKNLAKNLYYPLLSENGHKIDIETACKNMRKITLFGHCFGEKRIFNILEILQEYMKTLNYSEEEQKKIFSQIFVVSYGIWSGIPEHFKDVPVFNVLSPEDEHWMDTYRDWKQLFENFDKVQILSEDKRNLEKVFNSKDFEKALYKFYDKNQRCFVLRNGQRLSLACSGLQKNFYADHSLGTIARNADWSRPKIASDAGDYVSRCIACALCNSVANALLNEKSKQFVPFDLDEIQAQMEEFVRTLNRPALANKMGKREK